MNKNLFVAMALVLVGCLPTPTVSPLPTPTRISPIETPALSRTPRPTPASAEVAELVLCDGKTFDGVKGPVFDIDAKRADYMNPAIKKVIRGCTFKNITNGQPAIRIKSVRNLVVEDNVFYNIRSGQPGIDTNAVSAHGAGVIDGLWFEGNSCDRIGSDCIQIGGQGTQIGNVFVRYNDSTGSDFYGENFVDVKSNDPNIGPLLIAYNTVRGYRPCEPRQDCSGSQGPAIVIHDGSSAALFANGVQLVGNVIEDSTYGINVGQGAKDTVVSGNTIRLSVKAWLIASNANGLTLDGNTFDRNPTQALIDASVKNCRIGSNTFIGKQGISGGAQCTKLNVPPTLTPTPPLITPSIMASPSPSPTRTPSPSPSRTPTTTPRPRLLGSGVALWLTCADGSPVIVEPSPPGIVARCP